MKNNATPYDKAMSKLALGNMLVDIPFSVYSELSSDFPKLDRILSKLTHDEIEYLIKKIENKL